MNFDFNINNILHQLGPFMLVALAILCLFILVMLFIGQRDNAETYNDEDDNDID